MVYPAQGISCYGRSVGEPSLFRGSRSEKNKEPVKIPKNGSQGARPFLQGAGEKRHRIPNTGYGYIFYPEKYKLFVRYRKQQINVYLSIHDLKQVVLFSYENWAKNSNSQSQYINYNSNKFYNLEIPIRKDFFIY